MRQQRPMLPGVHGVVQPAPRWRLLPGTLSFLPAAVHLLELLVRAMPSCSGDAWPLPGAGPKRPAALSRPLPPEPPAPPPAPELQKTSRAVASPPSPTSMRCPPRDRQEQTKELILLLRWAGPHREMEQRGESILLLCDRFCCYVLDFAAMCSILRVTGRLVVRF